MPEKKKPLIVLKFGGSSITKKEEQKFEMNYAVLNRAASELTSALHKKKFSLILVCGVGPFGHTNVVKYNLNNGVQSDEQLAGMRKTNADCDFVGKETVKALKKQGLKAELISGYNICQQDNKKVISFDFGPYEKALKKGVIPVTTGIMVEDSSLNWSVMSGDQVIAQTAKKMRPEKVLMGTDVDGIFTADPKIDPKAELIELINKNNVPKILERVGESKAVDVTGGMKGKLEKLAQQLNGVPAEIFNLMAEGNLQKILEGKKVKDTKIRL